MKYTTVFLIALLGFSMAYNSPADNVLKKVDSLVESA